jgi:hypothetical protein
LAFQPSIIKLLQRLESTPQRVKMSSRDSEAMATTHQVTTREKCIATEWHEVMGHELTLKVEDISKDINFHPRKVII